ncbi:MAG: hydrogenase, partial [Acidobacteria bacterium ACB2]|nr:hydrogenase [Acidobacteria bacterium ACB2]
TLVGIFQVVLRPRRHARRPAADEPVTGRWLFPEAARFESHVPDTVFEALVSPVVGLADRVAERARLVRTGRAQTYVLYVFVTLVLLLLFAV